VALWRRRPPHAATWNTWALSHLENPVHEASRAAALCESSRWPEGVGEGVSDRRTVLVCPSAIPVSRPPRTKKAVALNPGLSHHQPPFLLARRIIAIPQLPSSIPSLASIISYSWLSSSIPALCQLSRLPSSTPGSHYHQLLLPLTGPLSLPRSHLRSQGSHEQWVPST
jgi:hypothetical protein